MNCQYCGTINTENSYTCVKCGAPNDVVKQANIMFAKGVTREAVKSAQEEPDEWMDNRTLEYYTDDVDYPYKIKRFLAVAIPIAGFAILSIKWAVITNRLTMPIAVLAFILSYGLTMPMLYCASPNNASEDYD